MLASDVISPVRDALFDTAGVRWPDVELFRYISHGLVVIVGLRPDANAITRTVQLVGGTLQSIPSNAMRLLRVVRNRGGISTGDASGKVVRQIDRSALDTEDPSWHTRRASAVIQHYMTDPYIPRQFYVYPPAVGPVGQAPSSGNPSAYVEIVYSARPDPVTALNQDLILADQYLTPLIEFALYRAFAKDSSSAGNLNRAQMHLQSFAQALGLNFSAEVQAAAAAPMGA